MIRSAETLIHTLLRDCEIIYVADPTNLVDISSNAAQRSEVIIACGGDGTAQSVARGVYGSDALLGMIPFGSGNDFAKSIGLQIKQPLEYYIDIILQKNILHVDIPTINNKIFLNTIGVGFDGLTNLYASQMKTLTGSIKYTAAGLKAFLTAKPFEVSINLDEEDSVQQVWLFAIANGAIEGGKYKISPTSVNTDGKLELVIVPAYNRVKLALAFILLSLGRYLPDGYSKVLSFKRASFKTEKEQFIHLDGEVGKASKEYQIFLNTERLRVIGVNPVG